MSPIRVVCAPRPRSVVSESARRVALSRLILRFTTAGFCYARSRNSQKARSFFPAGRKVGQKHDPAQQLTRHARHMSGRAAPHLARRARTARCVFFAVRPWRPRQGGWRVGQTPFCRAWVAWSWLAPLHWSCTSACMAPTCWILQHRARSPSLCCPSSSWCHAVSDSVH